jgi:hypothetical protein
LAFIKHPWLAAQSSFEQKRLGPKKFPFQGRRLAATVRFCQKETSSVEPKI